MNKPPSKDAEREEAQGLQPSRHPAAGAIVTKPAPFTASEMRSLGSRAAFTDSKSIL